MMEDSKNEKTLHRPFLRLKATTHKINGMFSCNTVMLMLLLYSVFINLIYWESVDFKWYTVNIDSAWNTSKNKEDF